MTPFAFCPRGGGGGVSGRHPLPGQTEKATAVDGTHPTGMHSRLLISLHARLTVSTQEYY